MEIQEIDVALCTQRIRGLVERANGGVKEVATDSGVCQAAIYNYLKGRVPGLMQLFLLAQYADKPMEWFLRPVYKARASFDPTAWHDLY